jgi:anti-sigma factor RsiW
MGECRDIEPLLASYVDDAAEPDARAAVEAHLRVCPACCECVSAERGARELVRARRETLRGCASEQLKRRCAAHGAAIRPPAAPHAQRPFIRRTLVPLSLAATLAIVAVTFFLTFSRNAEVLAAQLAADHVSCFKFAPEPGRLVDAATMSQEWGRTRGWPITIPAGSADHGLTLIDVRRCGSSDGIAAHLMYKWRGAPLSVYVMNSESRRARYEQQLVETLGQEAVVWKDRGRTYVVVAQAPPRDLEKVVKYVKATAW